MATPAGSRASACSCWAAWLLFALGLFMIGDRQMAFAKKFTVYTEFTKITGLQPGAIVRVLGAKAGSITQILPPSTPSEKFRVEARTRREPASAGAHRFDRHDRDRRARGRQLSRHRHAAPTPLRRSRRTATIASKEPFEITDLMQQMGDTITKVNVTIDEMKGDVQSAVVAVADTMGNANALITDVSDDVKKMAASGATDHRATPRASPRASAAARA